jgi:steroid delta-isomerase-like uncharacterized protein
MADERTDKGTGQSTVSGAESEAVSAARRFFDEVWNHGNVAAVRDFLADDFVSHNSFDLQINGAEEYGRGVTLFRSAFPDLVSTVEDAFAAGDRVAVRGTDRGTHRGQFLNFPPTGRQVTVTWIEIFRMENGKAVEGWVESDTGRLREQMG